MGEIVNIPLGKDVDLDISFAAGKLKVAVELSVVDLLKQIRAGSTNSIENAILDVAISALSSLSPTVPPAA